MGGKTNRAVVAVRQSTHDESEAANLSTPRAVDTAHALVFLHPSTFRLCWFAVVTMHLMCAAFVISVAVVYLYVRQCIVINTINTYSIAIDMKFWIHVAIMYLCIAVVHLWHVVRILSRSVRARSLVFRLHETTPPTATATPAKSPPKPLGRQSFALAKQATTRALHRAEQVTHPRVSKTVKWIWKALVAFRGAMNVRSQHYGLFFLSRGVWQTILQSHQAYRLAGLLPREWMNSVIVTLLICKCWSTTLLHYIFPHNVGKLRLACVMVSLTLDVAGHAAIPLALFYPYLQAFNYDVGDFALELWYTDVWFAEIINEAQLLFVTSWGDAFSKFMVAMSLARWLNTITQLVRELPTETTAHNQRAASIFPDDTVASQAKSLLQPPRTRSARLERGGQRVLFLWGVVVLAAHLHSRSVPARPQCLLRTRPWFTTKPSCSLLGYDCHQEKSSGADADIDAFLDQFDLNRVGFLVISECPQLQMPPLFNDLHELVAMKLFRSTINRWDSSTAVTGTHHPKFLSIFLADVNMTEMPAGLLSPDFPPKFMDIQVVQTNMTRLPDNLASVWPQNMILILENSQFSDFPAVLQYMAPTFLSLAKNNISSVPREVLESISPIMLFLAGNPVQSLPSELTTVPGTGWYNFVASNVSELPAWIDPSAAMIEAGGSPLCDRLIQEGKATVTDTPALFGLPGIDCSLWRIELEALGWYPPGKEEVRNPSYVFGG